ncbi:MAG: regulatory protein RecX [Woeseiaceae bacterium]
MRSLSRRRLKAPPAGAITTAGDDRTGPEGEADARFSDPLEARKKAMDYLTRREYGLIELRLKLTGAGFDEQAAASAVLQLSHEGLQDDRRFIENFIRSRIHQGKGPVRIRLELKERGADEALVGELLEESGEDWAALARGIRRRKFGAELPGDFREKARQMRFLQYRGFEQAQIQAAVVPDDD